MTVQIQWEPITKAAFAARENAWAPYSKFRVGAALLVNNDIFVGCNVENGSYPVGICAERGAIAAMVAAGHKKPDALVIAAGPLITPCGMCRQALFEFSSELPILLVSADLHKQHLTNLETLLPSPFII